MTNCKLRSCLALLAVAVLAFAVTPSAGFYSRRAILGAVTAMVLALAACFLRDVERGNAPRATPQAPWFLLAAVALLVTGLAIFNSELLYGHGDTFAECLLRVLPLAGFLLVASLLLSGLAIRNQRSDLRPRIFRFQILALFATGAALRICPIIAVPEPRIDVFNALRDAPAHLLAGRNPYTAEYDNPYPFPPHSYDLYPFYPPLPILFGLPFRVAGLDVRLANVVCDLVAAWILFHAGRSRGCPLAGAFAAGIYLHFPRVPFVMEQAWYEPMLAASLGAGLYLVERYESAEPGRSVPGGTANAGRNMECACYNLGYFLLGLGLTGKQYGIVLLPPLLKSLWRTWKRLSLGIAAATALVIGPFFLSNPRAFLDVIFFAHMDRPVQPESITILVGAEDLFGFVTQFGIKPARALLFGIAVVLIGLITWRTPAKTTASALWLGTALLTFCLCHTQGFFNYFYLCEYVFLLGIVGLIPKPT